MAAPVPGNSTSSKLILGEILLEKKEIPYAYFPPECKPENILKVLIKEWKLQIPKIILVVMSDNKAFSGWSDFNQRDNFAKGLIKACNGTSAWIVTNGLNVGIVKTIAESFRTDYQGRCSLIYRDEQKRAQVKQTPLIGISCDSLLTYGAKFNASEMKQQRLKNLGNRPQEDKFDLNPNHSNFLILEDKSKGQISITSFLLNLTDTIISTNKKNPDDEVRRLLPPTPIPVVFVLVKGDVHSVQALLTHIEKKRPLLILRGGGGLADIMAAAYYDVRRSYQRIKDADYVDNVLKARLFVRITSAFPTLKDNRMGLNILCDRILACFIAAEPPEMKCITVLDMMDLSCEVEDMPTHLLETIFKSQKLDASDIQRQLTQDLILTIDWNCPALAKTKVFYKDPTFKVDNDVFQRTIMKSGREEFVSIFLEHGFEVHKFTDSERVISLFKYALKEHFFREVCWEGILGYRKPMKLDADFIDSDLNWIIVSVIEIPNQLSSQELDTFAALTPANWPQGMEPEVPRRRALMVLIIWALFSGRDRLALQLWRQTDEPVLQALICQLILDRINKYIRDETTRENNAKFSKKFATMAVGVFDHVYQKKPSKAFSALSQKNPDWTGRSLINLSAMANNLELVAHPCCQKWLNNLFMGKIRIIDIKWGFFTVPTYIKVILCAFLICPMYFWVRFQDDSDQSNEEKDVPKYLRSDANDKYKKAQEGRFHMLKYHYPPLGHMINWMWDAPITKFWVSSIFYMAYLSLFSIAVIWPSCGNPILDLMVCVWTLLIAFDSLYLLYALNKVFPSLPMFGACLEITYMILFVIFYALFRLSPSNLNPYTGKVLICLGLLWFYYRMIFIYLPISSTLGPILYRVHRMVNVDFYNFVKLVSLIIIGNAIAMQAVLYPDFPLSMELFRKAFHKALIAFFMTPVEELSGKLPYCVTWEQQPINNITCRIGPYTDPTCPVGGGVWSYIIVFQYLMLIKLIVLTTLFALFNNTGAKLGPESDNLWKFQRYHLVMQFSASLRLPPPLNIISLLYILYLWVKNLLEKMYKALSRNKVKTSKSYVEFFRPMDYKFFKHCAQDYFEREDNKEKQLEYSKNEDKIISKLLDDVESKNQMLNRIKSQMLQLEADVSFTQAHLEALKYREKEEDEKQQQRRWGREGPHVLSRESPYPCTSVRRFPVPDKYVPWEVAWMAYEPNTFTKQRDSFHPLVRNYVDEDLLQLHLDGVKKSEIPRYVWNMESRAHGYLDRSSWIADSRGLPLIYKLDRFNLPRNPMGRTGLRGKGSLLRWGPNHHIYVVVTRMLGGKESGSDHVLLGTSASIQYVEVGDGDFSLPGGFVETENLYEMVYQYFDVGSKEPWRSSDQMIQFFTRFAVIGFEEDRGRCEFKTEKLRCGYMDDQLNTDQAWKEVLLWHVHYTIESNITATFHTNVTWKFFSEEAFIRLPYGQSALLQTAINSLDIFLKPGI